MKTGTDAKTVIADVARLDLDGDGVVEIDGREQRVPCVIPGERVEIVPASRGRDAILVRVVTPSPHRVAPPCRHFGPCGGCAWQHIAYEEQLRQKQILLQRLLSASLGPRAPVVPLTLPTPAGGDASPASPWHYRNKVHFVFGPGGRGHVLAMGHYRRGSRTIIPVVECPVHAEEGNRVAFALRDSLERAKVPGASGGEGTGIARHVVVRVAETSGDCLATLVVTENARALRRVTADFVRARVAPGEDARGAGAAQPRQGLFLSLHARPGPFLFGREIRHLAGARAIRETVAGISYQVSPTSFFQTNVRATRVLVAQVLDALGDSSYARVLDLYAGAGLFALPLARAGRIVTAVEESAEATSAAARAAGENQVPASRFRPVTSRVEDVTARLTPPRCPPWDAVVLDPPRQGCPPHVLDWILATLRPRRVVYVSCNPEALANDLRLAPSTGYEITAIQPVDMFPHTPHVEAVAVLSRQTPRG